MTRDQPGTSAPGTGGTPRDRQGVIFEGSKICIFVFFGSSFLDLSFVACVALKPLDRPMGEEAAKDMLLELVQEMYEQNSYRMPAAKRVRDATGLSLAEAKELLDECKPMLKKPKPGSAKPAAPPEEPEASVPDTQIDEDTKTPEKTAEMKPEKGKVEVKEAKSESCSVLSYTPEQPDNQEGLSPRTPFYEPSTPVQTPLQNPSDEETDEKHDSSQKIQKQGTQRPLQLVFVSARVCSLIVALVLCLLFLCG